MSLFLQGLRAIRQRAPTLGPKSPELADQVFKWLGELSVLDAGAGKLWPLIQAGFERRKPLFQETYPSGRRGIPPFKFRSEVGEETISDLFHAFAIFQQRLEKLYDKDPTILPPGFLGAQPSPTDDAQRRWSLLSQNAVKLVGGSVVTNIITKRFSTSSPATISISFIPHIPRAFEIGYSLPGRSEAKTALQQDIKSDLIRCYPVLDGWEEPLGFIKMWLGHCAEARAWIRFLWYLLNGGTVWALAAAPKHLAEADPSGGVVWETLISHPGEKDFLNDLTRDRGSKSEPMTCSCEFCRNCAGAAKELKRALGCDIVDIEPLLRDPELRLLLIQYMSDIRGVLLGSRTL
ncbi:hypothetical protein C8F04DRAFT_1141812 [Mycena alexandri]|uniref:Uncharacterized protein n=1 Tax=Mycena alexandri TaxID=1745969 RepID=A0AAD6S4R2_9AGAR|nr:hypothetical protein C8F04DRAFT_1141812 [Mycena alexandri]